MPSIWLWTKVNVRSLTAWSRRTISSSSSWQLAWRIAAHDQIVRVKQPKCYHKTVAVFSDVPQRSSPIWRRAENIGLACSIKRGRYLHHFRSLLIMRHNHRFEHNEEHERYYNQVPYSSLACWSILNTKQVENAPHKAKLSHELIAGAAAYEVRKMYRFLVTTSDKITWFDQGCQSIQSAFGE